MREKSLQSTFFFLMHKCFVDDDIHILERIYSLVFIAVSLPLSKDYCIDGQNTQLIFFEKNTTGGGKKTPQITPRGGFFGS